MINRHRATKSHEVEGEWVDPIAALLADEERWYVRMGVLKDSILADRTKILRLIIPNMAPLIIPFVPLAGKAACYYKREQPPTRFDLGVINTWLASGRPFEIHGIMISEALKICGEMRVQMRSGDESPRPDISLVSHQSRRHDQGNTSILVARSPDEATDWLCGSHTSSGPVAPEPVAVEINIPQKTKRPRDQYALPEESNAETLEPRLEEDRSRLVPSQREERELFDAIKAKPKGARSADEIEYVAKFRSKMADRRSTAAQQEREVRNDRKRKEAEELELLQYGWTEILSEYYGLTKKTRADNKWGQDKFRKRTSQKKDGRERTRSETRRDASGFSNSRFRTRYIFSEAAAYRNERLRNLRLGLREATHSPIWESVRTAKGYRVLAGEDSSVTALIHRLCRCSVGRALIDFEISMPPGIVIPPAMAGYAAARIATRFHIDPRRCTAATHIGRDETGKMVEESKARPGEPVKDHLHIAMPAVSSDPLLLGLVLDKEHIHGWIQVEVAAIQIDCCGIDYHVPPITAGHIKKLSEGQDVMRWLGTLEDFTPERVREMQLRGWRVDLKRGHVDIPFSATDDAVARIPMPPPRDRSPLGVPHLNTLSDKRKRLMKADAEAELSSVTKYHSLMDNQRTLLREIDIVRAYTVGAPLKEAKLNVQLRKINDAVSKAYLEMKTNDAIQSQCRRTQQYLCG